MASAFAHGLVGYTVGRLTKKRPDTWTYWFTIIGLAILPDLDVLAFTFGVPYDSPFGHRGVTHSILFAAAFSLFLVTVVFRGEGRRLILFGLFFLSLLSHGVCDAITSGGLGVGFFIPFTDERYFFEWRPVLVSPIGVLRFFSERGLAVLASEAMYIGIPCMIVLACRKCYDLISSNK